MVRIRLEDFKAWYGSNTLHDLYHRCLLVAKYDPAGQANRAVTIDESQIQGIAFQKQFREWVAANPDKVLPVAQPSYPELDALQPQDPPLQPAKTKAPEQRLADTKAAQTRYLEFWVAQQGLLNSVENGVLLDSWFAAHSAEYSVATIDQAITECRASLQWFIPPVVERLPNGDERMPLSARPSSRWTKAQLQDWDSRRRAALSVERRAENTKIARQYR